MGCGGPADDGAGSRQDSWTLWAGAVNLMASGDYSSPWQCFAQLAECDNPEIAGLSCAAQASGLRQLGEHAEAAVLDDRAISATGAAVLDGLIGRAADEIGLGDPGRCRHYLERADRILAESVDKQLRGRVRIGWVTAEAALLQGDSAVAPAQLAVEAAHTLDSPRHILKSLLIRGVALRETGDPAGDTELLTVLRSADDLGIRTLVWPAALALEDRLPDGLMKRAADAAHFIRNHLPSGRFDSWLRITHRLEEGV